MDLKHVIAFVLPHIPIVVVAARLVGRLFRRIGQPAVIGEIVAGIALGPTLLGAFPGDLDQVLFPADVRPFLAVIAQLGLALFMFIVGLEVDLSLIRGRKRAAGAVAAGSIVLPFALGAELGLIAAAGDELRVLARELEACGTPSCVVARFAPDPAALAVTLRADLALLTGDATGHLAALAAVPEATVVVARLGDGRARVGAVLAAVVVLVDAAEPPVDLGEHTPVLWVRPSGADVDDDLDQALGRIALAAPDRSV